MSDLNVEVERLRKCIGMGSEPVVNVVEKGAVRKFAEAIGDHNAIYWDEETGKRSMHDNMLAPPTFPRTFDYGEIELFELPTSGLIHGEQTFTYFQPIKVGDQLACSFEVKDVSDKIGSTGRLVFVVMEQKGQSLQGEPVFSSTQTLVITEKVLEGMSKR